VLLDSLLVTGFPYDVHTRGEDLVALFGYFLGRARAVRRLGSAALDLCYVAAGRFEAFWEQHLKPWDVAAGALIVEEAGGLVTGMDGAPFDAAAGHLVASNRHVHQQVLDVIAEFRSRRRPKGTG
jgi:myo-inositol-1(or 4)-monophosphatase